MYKTILISSLAAACWLATAASAQNGPMQAIVDAPGVTVSLNGAIAMHRTGVNYPAAAMKAGVQGTVSVQVKLDSTGNVNDAQVLSGPDELRKAVLESVLQWHFTHEVAGTTRVIQVAFEVPKAGAVQAGVVAPRGEYTFSSPLSAGMVRTAAASTAGRVTSIRIVGLPEQATAELAASLPVHEGDEWNGETMQKTNQAVRAFDEHLTIQTSRVVQTSSGTPEVSLRISVANTTAAVANTAFAVANTTTAVPVTAGTPGRVKVGGNVQGAMIVSKVPPVYPAVAKQAAVSGMVRLAAVIAKDGSVQELTAQSGPPLLIQAALDAVKQWVYKPTLLNGSPVEVETTIDINFTLNQ